MHHLINLGVVVLVSLGLIFIVPGGIFTIFEAIVLGHLVVITLNLIDATRLLAAIYIGSDL